MTVNGEGIYWERLPDNSIRRIPLGEWLERITSGSPLVGDVDYDPPVTSGDTEDPER